MCCCRPVEDRLGVWLWKSSGFLWETATAYKSHDEPGVQYSGVSTKRQIRMQTAQTLPGAWTHDTHPPLPLSLREPESNRFGGCFHGNPKVLISEEPSVFVCFFPPRTFPFRPARNEKISMDRARPMPRKASMYALLAGVAGFLKVWSGLPMNLSCYLMVFPWNYTRALSPPSHSLSPSLSLSLSLLACSIWILKILGIIWRVLKLDCRL